MKKKLRLSIGIPAYNEGSNIENLIRQCLSQNRKLFELKKIIVVSDASTDNTVQVIRKIKNNKIRLLINKKRLGQALTQNKILKSFSEDILVLLNGDILLGNKDFLNEMIRPFYKYKNIGIVAAKRKPLPEENLFEKIINYSVNYQIKSYEEWNEADNLYLCSGRARAFSKKFINNFKWPAIINEDVYSYFVCKENDFKFMYQKKALIYFKSPSNLNDHNKQSLRFLAGYTELRKYFNDKFIKKNYTVPLPILIKNSFLFFLHNPFIYLYYAIIVIITRLNSKFAKNNLNILWAHVESSKISH